MSVSPAPKMPALDYALSVIGPLSGVSVVLGRGLTPDQPLLGARLRAAGADVRTGLQGDPSFVLGAVEGDLSGHLGATSYGAPLAQNLPVVDLFQSPLMRLAHDHIGIGQASVMALLDITNLQLAGRVVVVCGYGPTGAGVAAHAAALGGRVTVVETDPVQAATARLAGHTLDRFAGALPGAEVVFATDDGPYLGVEHLEHLCTGTLLCAAGANAEISPAIIAFVGDFRPVRAHVSAFDLPHAQGLKLIAEGRPLHFSHGQGLPLEIKDIVLALHILALAQLMRVEPTAPASRQLDPTVEAALAAILVATSGGVLEG